MGNGCLFLIFLKIKILIIKKGIASWRTQTNRPDSQIDICSFNPRQLKVMEALKIIPFTFLCSRILLVLHHKEQPSLLSHRRVGGWRNANFSTYGFDNSNDSLLALNAVEMNAAVFLCPHSSSSPQRKGISPQCHFTVGRYKETMDHRAVERRRVGGSWFVNGV